MRALLRLTLPLLIAALAVAEEKETAPLPAGKTALTEKKSCPLCKLPGRAALFAGNAKAGKCITDCADLCCKGAELVLLLEGIANKDGARRVISTNTLNYGTASALSCSTYSSRSSGHAPSSS